jgi:uncharacterized SAM-binding protein YcdF (DUF218 family)
MGDRRLLRLLGAATLLLGALAAFTPLSGALVRRLGAAPQLGRADAIVVLGSSVYANGALSGHSLDRTVHGIRLYRGGYAPMLVLLGTAPDPGDPSESEVRRALARDLGVPPGAILVGEASNTRGEAARAAALLQPRGMRRILLVTEPLHLTRARPVFERAGFQVLPAPVAGWHDAADPGDRFGQTMGVLTEALARTYYRLTGQL